MNKVEVKERKHINWSAVGKLIELVIVLSMGVLSYVAITQDNSFMQVIGAINAVQMARLVHKRWF